MNATPNNEEKNTTVDSPTSDEIKAVEEEIARAQADLEAAQAKLEEKTAGIASDQSTNSASDATNAANATTPSSTTNTTGAAGTPPPPPQEYYWQQEVPVDPGVTGQTEKDAQQAYQAPPSQQPPNYQPAYTYPGATSKDHVAAGLLAIFLGALGIHKFYLGYNTAGFIMLAITVLGSIPTFGLAAAVMGVIAIIEGILYLVKPQSEFETTYVFNKREWF